MLDLPALYIALHTRQAAMGVAGVEGGFRAGCEAAVGALRVGGPALGALLAASLADPLIDWAAERDDRHARQARPCARCQGSVAVTGTGVRSEQNYGVLLVMPLWAHALLYFVICHKLRRASCGVFKRTCMTSLRPAARCVACSE